MTDIPVTVDNVQLPEDIQTANEFTVGDRLFRLAKDNARAWAVESAKDGGWHREVEFTLALDEISYEIQGDEQGPVPVGADWRAIVRNATR